MCPSLVNQDNVSEFSSMSTYGVLFQLASNVVLSLNPTQGVNIM